MQSTRPGSHTVGGPFVRSFERIFVFSIFFSLLFFFLTYIIVVVAHELAHQWFGNLVTMDWWSELWASTPSVRINRHMSNKTTQLNEGFATWVGWYVLRGTYIVNIYCISF